MLRLVFLASLSVMSGCGCDALWGRYEVPCTAGFDCPDAAAPTDGSDMAHHDDQDMAMPDDGSTPDGGTGDGGPSRDMRSPDDGGAGFDMITTGKDMIVTGTLDIGGTVIEDLSTRTDTNDLGK